MALRKRIVLESDEEEAGAIPTQQSGQGSTGQDGGGEESGSDVEFVGTVRPEDASGGGRRTRSHTRRVQVEDEHEDEEDEQEARSNAQEPVDVDNADFLDEESEDDENYFEQSKREPRAPKRRKAPTRRRSSKGSGSRLFTQGNLSGDEDESGSDGLRDFIVNSDEEEQEEDDMDDFIADDDSLGERRSAGRSRPGRGSIARRGAQETDGASGTKRAKPKAKARPKANSRASRTSEAASSEPGGKKRRRIALESGEESGGGASASEPEPEPGSEGEGEGGETGAHQGSEGSEDGEGEEEEDDGSGSASESSVDEAMLHMRHHAALELEDEGVPLFMTRKNLTLDQAFLLYVEMLARCIAVPSFREGIRRNPMASAYGRFTSAKRMVEGLLCTRRESLLGSMAWKPAFLQDLRSLPYHWAYDLFGTGPDKCDICNRSRHNCRYEVLLFGPRYDSLALWESSQWVKALPCPLEQLGDDVATWTDATEGRATYYSGSTCRWKTQCYSRLMHYKFRLLRRLAQKLRSSGSSSSSTGAKAVDALMEDQDFLDMEYDRLQSLSDLVQGMLLDESEVRDEKLWEKQLRAEEEVELKASERRRRMAREGEEEEEEGEDEEEEGEGRGEGEGEDDEEDELFAHLGSGARSRPSTSASKARRRRVSRGFDPFAEDSP